jgi:diaminopimelate epimerase
MRFVHDRGLTDKPDVVVETQSGLLRLTLETDGQVTVDMGEPRLQPADIPFVADSRAHAYPLQVNDRELEIAALSMGNPHAVLQVDDIEQAPVARLGPAIEGHPRFPERVNAGFMQVIDPEHIRLRVFERGAGETQACGSGACAAVVAGRLWDQLAPRVNVALRGGNLVVKWVGEGSPVYMTGPATQVFLGEIDL